MPCGTLLLAEPGATHVTVPARDRRTDRRGRRRGRRRPRERSTGCSGRCASSASTATAGSPWRPSTPPCPTRPTPPRRPRPATDRRGHLGRARGPHRRGVPAVDQLPGLPDHRLPARRDRRDHRLPGHRGRRDGPRARSSARSPRSPSALVLRRCDLVAPRRDRDRRRLPGRPWPSPRSPRVAARPDRAAVHRPLDDLDQVDFIYDVGPFSFIVALLAGAAGCWR